MIAHEFGYSLEYIGEMSVFQFRFLIDWLSWWGKACRK